MAWLGHAVAFALASIGRALTPTPGSAAVTATQMSTMQLSGLATWSCRTHSQDSEVDLLMYYRYKRQDYFCQDMSGC